MQDNTAAPGKLV